MLNSRSERQLVYLVTIDNIEPIVGSDNCEAAVVGGWRVMVRKGTFKPDDVAIYFEIDSLVDISKPEFAFMAKYHGKVKTQRYTFGGKNPGFYSQGLLMKAEDLGEGWTTYNDFIYSPTGRHDICDDSRFLTKELNVTYAEVADNKRKGASVDKYKVMASRHPKLFKKPIVRKIMKYELGRKIMFFFFGKKKVDNAKAFPTHFVGVSKTDQERAENMTWVLQDKTPFIVTQKCDGSSGTYILERKKKNKFEFYVCSRNVRMKDETQECFYGSHNYYWEVAKKYDIENKMKNWMNKNPDATFICWQGEICAPKIQGNPHKLSETHFFCFHWTDSINGRLSIVDADKNWKNYDMEVVPIVNTNYILPDDFEEFKLSAEGLYESSVCEGRNDCAREGFVYYKTTDPTFSFKNVSRSYLLKHGQN